MIYKSVNCSNPSYTRITLIDIEFYSINRLSFHVAVCRSILFHSKKTENSSFVTFTCSLLLFTTLAFFFGDLLIGRKPPVNQSIYDTLEKEQIFCMICSLKAIKQIEIFCMHRRYIDIRRRGGGVACKNVSAAVFNAFILSSEFPVLINVCCLICTG